MTAKKLVLALSLSLPALGCGTGVKMMNEPFRQSIAKASKITIADFKPDYNTGGSAFGALAMQVKINNRRPYFRGLEEKCLSAIEKVMQEVDCFTYVPRADIGLPEAGADNKANPEALGARTDLAGWIEMRSQFKFDQSMSRRPYIATTWKLFSPSGAHEGTIVTETASNRGFGMRTVIYDPRFEDEFVRLAGKSVADFLELFASSSE